MLNFAYTSCQSSRPDDALSAAAFTVVVTLALKLRTHVKVVHDLACAEAVKTRRVGLGQLFHSLNTLPSVEFLNAGRRAGRSARFPGNGDSIGGEREGKCRGEGGFWPIYDLRNAHVSCRIYEEFSPDLFGLEQGKRFG
ncbi:unnamed protein product [Ectocarpus sp. 12 AP-2014]